MNQKIIKPTPFGPVVILWLESDDSPKIVRILLSRPEISAEDQAFKLYPHSRRASIAGIDATAAAIKAFLEGEDIAFSLDIVDLNLCSSFQQSVLRAEHLIPWGDISTYQLLAAHLDKKNGARAVGMALASNPFPLIVPCHRVIRSDLYLGGYQGGLEMKRALLIREGICFDDTGRVLSKRFHYGKY